jgi:hypothetical protein
MLLRLNWWSEGILMDHRRHLLMLLLRHGSHLN